MLASKFGRISAAQEDRPLTNAEIERAAPSIFAHEAHHSRSQRYTQIPTIEVLDGLRSEGFQPFFACQTRVRKSDKVEFTKHMLRLRQESALAGREVNEIILLNSHDGSSSYQMIAGRFRFVCHNGLIFGDTDADVRVRHKGNVVDDVIEGAYDVVDHFERVDAHSEAMRALELPQEAQEAYAKAALEYRFGGQDEAHIPLTPSQVLLPRRNEDRGNNLWSTFNRVQENLTKGGLTGRTRKGTRRRTRAVTGIDSDVKLNRALWTLAESLEEALA
ncbi:DUF932 domain-containing protein [Halomonas sp. NO4]|uniref:DUF932 domain-containing protein n=1 Tax=Halomonas sp. NO4 TaxID=2484813 RepID=UPI0013D71D3D|nr:DUF932 domain-containing protein [Halomonas sp. NO4]